jgi:hypothetical protein
LVGKRGKKKAIIAVAHRLLVAVYHMLYLLRSSTPKVGVATILLH